MIKNIVSVAAAVLGAGALLAGCNFDQPSAGCIVQDGSWQVKYDLKEGQNISTACQATILKGETLGVFKFTDPEKDNSSVLTLRPAGLYSRATRDPGDPYLQTATGPLSDETDAQDFCGAPDFAPATVNAAALGTTPATAITYKFTNVKMYSAPDAPGTQLLGELTYTRDGCTSEYTARAIWPAVACSPASTNPADLCGEGSGINPDFAVECDPALNRCVPSKAIPSFKVDR